MNEQYLSFYDKIEAKAKEQFKDVDTLMDICGVWLDRGGKPVVHVDFVGDSIDKIKFVTKQFDSEAASHGLRINYVNKTGSFNNNL